MHFGVLAIWLFWDFSAMGVIESQTAERTEGRT